MPAAELAALLAHATAMAFTPGPNTTLRGWLLHGERLLWFNRAMALVLAATALWMLMP